MSNDQKIMDKFVEQAQEILVLKASNRVLNFEIKSLESKLKIAVEALKTAENNACSCCDSNLAVDEHCQKAIKEMDAVNEKI